MVKQNFLSGFFGNGGKTEFTGIEEKKVKEDFKKIIKPYKEALSTMDEATARAQHLREALVPTISLAISRLYVGK